MTLKDKIKDWNFPSNPTEEKGLCWRWTKDGLDLMEEYIQEIIKERDIEWLEAIGEEEKTGFSEEFTQLMGEKVFDKLKEILNIKNVFRMEIKQKMEVEK